jgi:hypothetical protein
MRHENRAGRAKTAWTAWKAAIRFILAATLVAVFLRLPAPPPASAELPGVTEPSVSAPPCAPYAQMRQMLTRRFGETPRAVGLAGHDRLVQVFTGTGGSWTILVIFVSGQSCILAAGEAWEEIPRSEPREMQDGDREASPGDPA